MSKLSVISSFTQVSTINISFSLESEEQALFDPKCVEDRKQCRPAGMSSPYLAGRRDRPTNFLAPAMLPFFTRKIRRFQSFSREDFKFYFREEPRWTRSAHFTRLSGPLDQIDFAPDTESGGCAKERNSYTSLVYLNLRSQR